MRGFNMNSGEKEVLGPMTVRTLNTLEQVSQRTKELQTELDELQEIRSILEKNPDIQRLLTLMRKVHF